MARRWTTKEENFYRDQLIELYVLQNKSIAEVGEALSLSYKTVFKRLMRLGIPTNPSAKAGYANMNREVSTPSTRTDDLAEFFGIMLGDGSLTPTQVAVTLGTKEASYAEYVSYLMAQLFAAKPVIRIDKSGYRIVYFGSVTIVRWLKEEGLVHNKVASQVGSPGWIFEQPSYMKRFLRGFFDTDGSIYRIRFGIQISFTNKSIPLLIALQAMLRRLGYRVSELSAYRIYITKRDDVERFFAEIQPMNAKHKDRLDKFCVGGGVGQSHGTVNPAT